MLADGSTSYSLGKLALGANVEGRSRTAIIDFILEQLPIWRDRPERPAQTSETRLTSQLCAHLNSATRKASGWDCLQFRVEETDETEASRKVDLVAASSGDALIVQGRSYNDFEIILPIECKRLPIPTGTGREECEYVATRVGVGGGIQRYKEGKHGAAHVRAVLIAYVQEQSFDHWIKQIGVWIQDLCKAGSPGWSLADGIITLKKDNKVGIAVHESVHNRVNLPEIQLHHMWVKMTL